MLHFFRCESTLPTSSLCTVLPCSHMIAFAPSHDRLLNCLNLPLALKPSFTYSLSSSLPCCCISSSRLSFRLGDGHMLPLVALSWPCRSPCLFSYFFVFSFSAALLFCFPWHDAIASDHLPHFLLSLFTFYCSPFHFPLMPLQLLVIYYLNI